MGCAGSGPTAQPDASGRRLCGLPPTGSGGNGERRRPGAGRRLCGLPPARGVWLAAGCWAWPRGRRREARQSARGLIRCCGSVNQGRCRRRRMRRSSTSTRASSPCRHKRPPAYTRTCTPIRLHPRMAREQASHGGAEAGQLLLLVLMASAVAARGMCNRRFLMPYWCCCAERS